MALLHPDSRLCDAILRDTSLIPVIARFGVSLGMGEKSIATVCKEHNLDADFFVTILNTYSDEEYFPEKHLQSFCIESIIDYLTKTNAYYSRFQLPNIERHFMRLIELSGSESNNLGRVYDFFVTVRNELMMRIDSDHKQWFPLLQSRLKDCTEPLTIEPITSLQPTDAVEEKLNDLLSLIVKHLTGGYDINLCHAVIFALTSLLNDIRQHNRIRNRILRPVAISLQCDSPVISQL